MVGACAWCPADTVQMHDHKKSPFTSLLWGSLRLAPIIHGVIEVIMRVRVRLCRNPCVSRRMRESWQLCYLTMALFPSPSLYCLLHWLYYTILKSTLLYRGFTSLCLTLLPSSMVLLDSTSLYHNSTSLNLTLHYSTIVILHSTWLWLYHGSSSLYFMHYCTMAL